MVEHVARLKSKYDDGEFIDGFGIPMIDSKKPYPYIEDYQMAKDINICNQSVETDIDEMCIRDRIYSERVRMDYVEILHCKIYWQKDSTIKRRNNDRKSL